ncbi:MAG: hypothetical protein H2062_03000 [Synechococcus sp.]|jgi:hypothetical protein|nr:hypothetical protein [Synechococcus sp.]
MISQSITAKLKRQGRKPRPTTAQMARLWSKLQISSSTNQNRTTFAAKDRKAKLISSAFRPSNLIIGLPVG